MEPNDLLKLADADDASGAWPNRARSMLHSAATEMREYRKELARMATAFDLIYQHSEYARDAVVTHYGTCHKPFVVECQRESSESAGGNGDANR